MAGVTAPKVYAEMSQIQGFCGYGSHFVRNNMYSHAWESFLGILLFMPLTQWETRAARNSESTHRNH